LHEPHPVTPPTKARASVGPSLALSKKRTSRTHVGIAIAAIISGSNWTKMLPTPVHLTAV
jgi:hypothetical protein